MACLKGRVCRGKHEFWLSVPFAKGVTGDTTCKVEVLWFKDFSFVPVLFCVLNIRIHGQILCFRHVIIFSYLFL